ncbi:TniB family NTP-binding protein [Fibrobacter sp. UWH9]|uniref:TniB family NTP-binding protein n=1 Tax=Fibrobacter sp. UWH9 TaxID=1896213 RepID=UPI00158743AC|nr:TniB family NTP-binding protein [Fibrobacter sp. UWH9]
MARMISLPEYASDFRSLPANERLLKLTDLYRVFIPTTMAVEVYNKLYMMTSMSLKQKGGVTSVRQLNATYKWSHGGDFHGVATGATSATIIGDSGIGKTTCIQTAVGLLGDIIEVDSPYRKVIPVLTVSCPFDASYKGLLCQILISIDETLGTSYYESTQKRTINSQQVLGLVCQICHLYVGTLIIDEIQFLVEHKTGKQLYMMILQLINTACINVLLVGTNECVPFFRQAPQMARRSVGLLYGPLEYGEDFRNICEILFRYQYTAKGNQLTESLSTWLYEHCGGVTASLLALVHDAQEIAILKGKEMLGIETLTEAYNSRMKMLHSYVATRVTTTNLPQTTQIKEKDDPFLPAPSPLLTQVAQRSYTDIVQEAKKLGTDIVSALRKHLTIVEV